MFRYVRVSTLTQYDTDSSLQTQKAQIKAYCNSYDLNLQYIYRDEEISGRPALKTYINFFYW